ncbi:MAG TPA: M20/M25/M40 family metallo-hydrolase [Pyrinomonadaceae bacterium]|nr:M20/M25/M40 family metallo-hydrolase [Pyrinomonadaceae bacterium]
MLRRKFLGVLTIYAFFLPALTVAQANSVGTTAAAAPAKAVYSAQKEVIDKIRDEGMNHSQVMQTLSYLSDVIGQRLTASPSLKRANEWTRDTLAKWGLQNAHLEAWGPFGRGWVLKSFSAQVSEPYDIPLIAYPKAWAPSANLVNADVVYLNAKTDADLEKYKGQLKGKIVLISDPRELKPDFTGLGRRQSDEDLAKLAAAPDPATIQRPATPQQPNPEFQARRQAQLFNAKKLIFAYNEGAAMLVDNSRGGAGGTVFVQQATVAQEQPTTPDPNFRRLSPWQKEAESKILPQMTLATEHYNRLVRMIEQGEKLKISVNVDAQYLDDDGMVNNTVAEIPGTDPKLKDQIVMLGGHMDSWHAGTGATDNGAGVAVAMEAVRILQAAGLKPRRTIRIALWTGEEEGLLGSRAYVKQHFGEMKGAQANFFGPPDPNAPKPELVKGPEYEKLSAYFNLDNGTGKIRGVYMQGNGNVRPYFESWLTPFNDLGAKTLTLSNTGGTDHLSFDAIGLPGFQFIQDEIEYDTLTHHSNQDVFDRIQADDMKESATIMAAFVYQTAMMDEMMPKKGQN